MSEKKVILSIEDLSVRFNLRGRVLHAIRGLSVQVHKGESLATLYYDESNKDADINGAIKRLMEAYTFSQEPCNPSPIIIDKTGI